uniref:Uncharacterized protein n=1 Tax=Cryptococcus bacillisporus CA1280 TaxID=1296109 RepID=A0A0D0VTN1_CRYGA|nr:hypothetical protein I312_01845 [Cryptococcus bacillisporus CA1280]
MRRSTRIKQDKAPYDYSWGERDHCDHQLTKKGSDQVNHYLERRCSCLLKIRSPSAHSPGRRRAHLLLPSMLHPFRLPQLFHFPHLGLHLFLGERQGGGAKREQDKMETMNNGKDGLARLPVFLKRLTCHLTLLINPRKMENEEKEARSLVSVPAVQLLHHRCLLWLQKVFLRRRRIYSD